MTKTIKYHDYNLSYYLFPGTSLSEVELKKLHNTLLQINKDSGKNFEYGIFDPGKTWANLVEFYSKVILATYEKDGEYVGFFYNMFIPVQNEFLIHQGLVLIYKNSGIDLLRIPYLYSNILIKDFLKKDFYISNISATPSIIGIISEIFADVWPSFYHGDLRSPPKKYKEMADSLYKNYIKAVFPDGTVIDLKRFVLKSPLKEMGFGIDIRELPRHKDINHILFTNYWIDLNKGEDMVQIGMMTEEKYQIFQDELKQNNFTVLGE